MFAENNGEMVTEWRSRGRGLNVSARSRSRRLSEADTEPRLGVGGNLCCNVASINSSAPMRRYLTLVDLQKQHAFCFAVLLSGLVSIKASSSGWKEEIGEGVLFWHSHNGVLAGWSDNFVSKSSIQASRVSWAMLGHCTDLFFAAVRSKHCLS